MEVFVKSFVTYRTIKKATVISSALVLDSLDAEASTVTVKGTEINRKDTGNWLIADRSVFRIANVKPEGDRTILTLESPLDAFARLLEFSQTTSMTVGAFVAEMLYVHWIAEPDTAYAMPYLTVHNLDTTLFAVPDTDNSGCFRLSDYCRLMRKSYRVAFMFADSGSHLICTIQPLPTQTRQVSFEDGRSQLQSVAYSSSGMAKLTVLQDIDTGTKDSNGNPVYTRERTDWYLSESGEVSQAVPDRRASGEWGSLHIRGNEDVRSKVVETFAKTKSNHKLEFWSMLDLPVQADCTFMVYGELLQSYISYKRKTSTDKRFYYKSGELATTATEKLKGAIK